MESVTLRASWLAHIARPFWLLQLAEGLPLLALPARPEPWSAGKSGWRSGAALLGSGGLVLLGDLPVPSVEWSVLSYSLREGPQIPGA